MYRLHGFFTQNTMKPLYVLEELGVDYEYRFVDLVKGENRSDEFQKMTPASKVPVLEHDGEFLFESGPICRYVSSVEKSPLYPADKLQRARVDQWMTFFTCHPGRWLTTLYFEKIIKPAAKLGEPDADSCEQATSLLTSNWELWKTGLSITNGWPMMRFPLLIPLHWRTWSKPAPLASRWMNIHGSKPGSKGWKPVTARRAPAPGCSHTCRQ